MKSQDILTGLLSQLGQPVGCYSSKDVATVSSRIAHEGESFLEVTLPHLDDLLLEGLRDELLPGFPGWKLKRGWSHPEFLNGFWMRIFHPDGSLRPAPCIHSIRSIRQISRTFKKVFEVASDARVSTAIERFHAVEAELSELILPQWVDTMSEVAHYLFGEIVGSAVSSDRVFKHGPGAVAEKHDSVRRWDFPVVSKEIVSLVGIESFRPTWESLQKGPPIIDEIPARLIAVPKTAVKPRLISIEPSYNQFVQQSLLGPLMDGLCRFPVSNIRDQSRNQRLARIGSLNNSLATIDLSDASDRVSLELVQKLFSWNPTFVRFLELSRSRTLQTPSGNLLLAKFASMGSALTFPVETMVFLSVVIYTMCEKDGNFSRSNVRSYLTDERIGVYGDDIIIPSSVVPTLVQHLEEVGLKVNTEKSFSFGGFRESCGGDYWRGYNVTPVYVRRRMPSSTRDVSELVGLSSFRNNLVAKYGYGEATSEIDSFISGLIPYPAAKQESHLSHNENPDGYRGICRYGPDDIPDVIWNRDLFRREVKMMVPVGLRKVARGSSTGVLFKTLYDGFNQDPLHITHHGRPMSAKLKHRKVAIG